MNLFDQGDAAVDRSTGPGYGWPNAPHRTLRTQFVNEWLGKEQQGQESRPDEPVVGHTIIPGQEMPIRRFMGMPPNAESTGDIELRISPPARASL